MLDYIEIDDKSPILNQLPSSFKSAALLLHPFVQMPINWEKTKRKNLYQLIYPNDEEILSIGQPVSWKAMMSQCGLNSYEEVAKAILYLREKYERKDLEEKLTANLNQDLYYPSEDSTSIFILKDILNLFSARKTNHLYFSDPIFGSTGQLKIKDTSPSDIADLSATELILTDEQLDFAFMSLYGSFTTLFFAKDGNINDIVQSMNWEAIICNEQTYINWFIK